jgi:hypothetical protein
MFIGDVTQVLLISGIFQPFILIQVISVAMDGVVNIIFVIITRRVRLYHKKNQSDNKFSGV